MSNSKYKNLELHIPSSSKEVPKTTEAVFKFLEALQLSASEHFDLRLSFEEVLINAMKHGNKYQPELMVKVEVLFNDDEIRISIEDEGEGFSLENVKDPTKKENLEAHGGRGVYLVQHLVDELHYRNKGKLVVLVKKLKK